MVVMLSSNHLEEKVLKMDVKRVTNTLTVLYHFPHKSQYKAYVKNFNDIFKYIKKLFCNSWPVNNKNSIEMGIPVSLTQYIKYYPHICEFQI